MLEVLHQIEKQLPNLLEEEESWNSLYIDYEKPHVERLWTPLGENRIYLHKIHPCEKGESLYHPHPWPSAVRILNGKYEMGVGFSEGYISAPPSVAVMMMNEGTEYEMTWVDGWHYVRPLGEPTYSLMVTGKPWGRRGRPWPKKDQVMGPLSDSQRQEIFKFFKEYYGGING